MKKYITIIIFALLTGACNSRQDLKQKKESLSRLKDEMLVLNNKIKTLESEILKLDSSKKEENYILVSTVPPGREIFEHRIEVRGEIQSRTNVLLSAEMSGTIESIRVKKGQKVFKGQILIVINAEIIKNNISELKTSLELANTLFDRQKRLWDKQIGTEVQYLQAKNTKESLEGKLKTANSQLAMSTIKAPFNGTIDNLPVNEGELASLGQPLVRIMNPKDMYIIAEVSEAFIGKISKGDEVMINFITQNQESNSVITSISQVIKAANRTFSVEIKMPNIKISTQPNQVVIISIRDYKAENAITLPTNILQRDKIGNFLYESTEKEGKFIAEKIYVNLGKTFNGKTEILSGLNGHENIINKGFRDAVDGAIIKVINE